MTRHHSTVYSHPYVSGLFTDISACLILATSRHLFSGLFTMVVCHTGIPWNFDPNHAKKNYYQVPVSTSTMATAMMMTTNPPVTDNDTNTNTIASVTPDTTNKEATVVEKNDVPEAVIEPNNDMTQRGATVDNTARAEISVGCSSLQPHRSGKLLYILSLIQMYQDVYQQFITRFYKDMIWNMTKARRVLQSRSTTTTTNTTLLSVVHIPSHRTFSAQRRLFSDSTVRRSKSVLSECDTLGRSSMHHTPAPPPLTNENDPTEEWRPDHHNNHPTGLRQRRGRTVPPTLQLRNEEVVSPLESTDSKRTATNKNDNDDMIVSLLLLSSGTGTASDLTPIQTKSRQLLQYLTTIQTQLVQQLQQEINTDMMMQPPKH